MSSLARACSTWWCSSRHSLVSCSLTSTATALTGISASSAISSASNSKVKPLLGLAHGNATWRVPWAGQITRGTRACR